jgi:hypothetical protein
VRAHLQGSLGVSRPMRSTGTHRADRQCLSTLLTLARSSVLSRTIKSRTEPWTWQVSSPQLAAVVILSGTGKCPSTTPLFPQSRGHLIFAGASPSGSCLFAWLCLLRARPGIVMADGFVREHGLDSAGFDSQELRTHLLFGVQEVPVL